MLTRKPLTEDSERELIINESSQWLSKKSLFVALLLYDPRLADVWLYVRTHWYLDSAVSQIVQPGHTLARDLAVAQVAMATLTDQSWNWDTSK